MANRLVLKDLLMIVLALFSILLLFAEIVQTLSFEQQYFVQVIDLTIAAIFLADFLFNLVIAKDKTIFFKKYWWELLAAIPITSPTTQSLRILKLGRIFPLLEAFRFVRLIIRLKMILEASKKYTKQTTLIYIVIILGAIIVSGALAFYHFENKMNPHVHSFWDSFYWAATTTATVGYGDIYPVTTEGRVIALVLIFSGIGVLGAFITIFESHLLKEQHKS